MTVHPFAPKAQQEAAKASRLRTPIFANGALLQTSPHHVRIQFVEFFRNPSNDELHLRGEPFVLLLADAEALRDLLDSSIRKAKIPGAPIGGHPDGQS